MSEIITFLFSGSLFGIFILICFMAAVMSSKEKEEKLNELEKELKTK